MTSLRFKTFLSRIDRLASTIRYAILGNLFIWIAGCVSIPKATVPLKKIQLYWSENHSQSRLIVYLPGRSDKAEDFTAQGLWETLKEQGVPFDAVAVEAHLGYYLKGSIVDRIKEDVIEPAREKGYDEIWVVGNSLGGLGALLVEKELPGTWEKMILLAPFLGDDKRLYKQFDQAGGLRNWNPEVEFAKTDFSPRLWQWLKLWPEQNEQRPDTYLGYGYDDRLKLGIDYLVPLLEESKVTAIPGGHRWSVWKPLWEKLVKSAVSETSSPPA